MNSPTFTRLTPLYSAGRAICRLATTLMFDLKVYGLGQIPREGGVLVVGNHQSFLDPALYAVQVKRPSSFLAKSQLFEGHPLFGKLIRNLNAFPVRQGEGDVGAVRETIKRLQEGHMLCMFPEGGRTESGKIEPLLGGVGLIIRRAGPGVKVVPAAVHGAYQAWSRYRKLPRRWPVRLKYGPPMTMHEMKAGEIVKKIESEIRRLYSELVRDHPEVLERWAPHMDGKLTR